MSTKPEASGFLFEINRRIADPGLFTPRSRWCHSCGCNVTSADNDKHLSPHVTTYEPIPAWSARAVLAMFSDDETLSQELQCKLTDLQNKLVRRNGELIEENMKLAEANSQEIALLRSNLETAKTAYTKKRDDFDSLSGVLDKIRRVISGNTDIEEDNTLMMVNHLLDYYAGVKRILFEVYRVAGGKGSDPHGSLVPRISELVEILGECRDYFGDRQDINDNGGPNEAMALTIRLDGYISGVASEKLPDSSAQDACDRYEDLEKLRREVKSLRTDSTCSNCGQMAWPYLDGEKSIRPAKSPPSRSYKCKCHFCNMDFFSEIEGASTCDECMPF